MRLRQLLGALCAAASLCAASLGSAAIPATEQATAIEFYHAGLDHYFISADPAEISDLDTGKHPGWTRTGYRFPVIKSGSTYQDSVPMCRFYSPSASTHFYSAKASECEDVKAKFPDTWQFESAEVFRAFLVNPETGACPADTVPAYRLFNQRGDPNHRYTTQLSAYVFMLGKGYVPEGDGSPATPVAFCTPAGDEAVPAPSAAAPNCTVTASSGAPALGSTLALESTCTNDPTSYLWINCAGKDPKCSDTRTAASNVQYTLYSANAQGPGDPVGISVAWGGANGGPLPVCELVGSTATPTTGTNFTLSATCNQAPTSYEWVECGYLVQDICNVMPQCSKTAATCSISTSIPGFHRYMVAGINSAGKGARKPLNVEWLGGSNPGNPGNPNDPPPVCTIYSSDSNPVIGTQIRLTASCTGSPTSIVWGDGAACSSGIYCQVSSAAVGSSTYSVYGVNAAGTGNSATITLNWRDSSGPAAPVCTLTPSSTNPSVGTSITIAASCTNNPTAFTWTGCASTSSSCTDSGSSVGARTYSVMATNANGNSQPASVTVNWGAVPSQPPVCQISASSTMPAVGQSITLAASCTGSPTTFEWTNCTPTSNASPTCTTTSSAAVPVIYTVVGHNQYGASNGAGISVSWQSGSSGGGGGTCAQYGSVQQFTLGWGDGTRHPFDEGTFGNNSVIVMALTVPPNITSLSSPGYTTMYEYRGAPTIRLMTVSKSPCDFREQDASGANGPYFSTGGVVASIIWNVGPGADVALQPGQTYYFNFKNYNCTGVCNAAIETNFPK